MNQDSNIFVRMLRGLWRNTSALVALVLIVLAFVLGLRFGGGAGEGPSADAHAGHDHAGATEAADSGEPTLYTCSMHPSVRLPDPDAKCPICFMDLIPVGEDEGDKGAARELRMYTNRPVV